VVIDGFRGVLDFLNSPARAREFLYQLSAQLGVVGCTCIVTLDAEPYDRDGQKELLAADVIIGLWHEPNRIAAQRHLEVLKARGTVPIDGHHSLVFSPTGMECFTQVEQLPVRPSGGVPSERAAFGLPRLDRALSGGLVAGTSTMLAGSMSAGKTLFSLAWLLEGAKNGERGLFIGFQESARQLVDKASRVGMDLDTPRRAGTIDLWTQWPLGLDVNVLAAGLRARAAGVRRLVIDSALELEALVEGERVSPLLVAIIGYLRGEGVTAIFTREIATAVGPELDFSATDASVLAENVVLLRRFATGGDMRRAVTVLKMRFSGFDTGLYEFSIGERGIDISERWAEADGTLVSASRRQERAPAEAN
jgi:circadian clock protein KaiC